MALFSVIIPVYNVAPYLRECLGSVRAQTFRDWECVCVDDGSTDGSAAILDEYAAKDPRFRVIDQQNAGEGAARNTALDSLANGSLTEDGVLWFVDADDALHPLALEWAHSAFSRWPCASSLCLNHGNLSGTELPSEWPVPPPVEHVEVLQIHESKGLRGHRRGVGMMLFRRTAIRNLRFEPYVVGADVLFCETLYWKTDCWLYCEAPLYFYRMRPDSATCRRPSPRSVHDLLDVECRLLDLIALNKTKWTIEGIRDYLLFNRDFVWLTFQGKFFALPDEEMKPLIPLWCDVQRRQHSLLRERAFRRTALWIIRLLNSPRVCRWLVILPRKVLGKLNAIRERLGHAGLRTHGRSRRESAPQGKEHGK